MGDDGERIVEYMFTVLNNHKERTADRMEAARWLADRGFGRSVQGLEIDVAQRPSLDLTALSTEDLEAMLSILEKYEPNVGELAATGAIPFNTGSALPTSSRRR